MLNYIFRDVQEVILTLHSFIRQVIEQASSEGQFENAFTQLRPASIAFTSLTRLLCLEQVLHDAREDNLLASSMEHLRAGQESSASKPRPIIYEPL